MQRVLLIALVVSSLSAARAEAVTAKDIVDLTRAGLGEEVLLALIEVDGSLFTIDTDTLKSLKSAGVTDRVIEAMVRSGRTPPATPPPPAFEPQPAQPQVVVIEHERPVVQQVAVPIPVPVYVPAYLRPRRYGRHEQPVQPPFDPSPGFGADAPLQYRQKPAEPVYWGWGGKLRPDAWAPAPAAHQHDAPKAEPNSGARGRR